MLVLIHIGLWIELELMFGDSFYQRLRKCVWGNFSFHAYSALCEACCMALLMHLIQVLLKQKMGLWTFLEGLLLFANALAILNEDRFLAPRGWTLVELHGGRRNTLKGQIIGLIHACQFLRLPLILLNILVIVVKLFSG